MARHAVALFFTSDHHFGDARRLGIDRRPFPSADAMDAAMVERWNAAVGPGDEVWHLGDFARSRDRGAIEALLARLNGRKHLLVGNNDDQAGLAATGWSSVAPYAELVLDGTRLVLCHYPFRTWHAMGRGSLNLHGHSHGRLKPLPRQYDVGVDVWQFRPVALDEIMSSRRRVAAGLAQSRTGDVSHESER